MNKEQFFAYHSNAGGKIITCYIAGKLYNINKQEWLNLPLKTKIELPCGTLYTIVN